MFAQGQTDSSSTQVWSRPSGGVFCPKMYAIILYNLLPQELLLFAANGLVIPAFFVLNLSELGVFFAGNTVSRNSFAPKCSVFSGTFAQKGTVLFIYNVIIS